MLTHDQIVRASRLQSQIRQFGDDGREIILGGPIGHYPMPERRSRGRELDKYMYIDHIISCSIYALKQYFRKKGNKEFNLTNEIHRWLMGKTQGGRRKPVIILPTQQFYKDATNFFKSNLEAIEG